VHSHRACVWASFCCGACLLVVLPNLGAAATGFRDALEAVAPQMQRLAQLEADRVEQQEQQQQQQHERQAAAQESKECLLAIGAHIEGAWWPAWMEGLVYGSGAWAFVSKAAQHRMSGEQLARLYRAMLQQQPQRQQQHDEGVQAAPAVAAAGVCPLASTHRQSSTALRPRATYPSRAACQWGPALCGDGLLCGVSEDDVFWGLQLDAQCLLWCRASG
jgi:hypothetical protein